MYKQVMRLVRALKNLGAANDVRAAAEAGSGGKVMSKEQRAVRARELAQQRMDMVNSLSALVPLYSEAVLAYTRAFQELAVSVEAVSWAGILLLPLLMLPSFSNAAILTC